MVTGHLGPRNFSPFWTLRSLRKRHLIRPRQMRCGPTTSAPTTSARIYDICKIVNITNLVNFLTRNPILLWLQITKSLKIGFQSVHGIHWRMVNITIQNYMEKIFLNDLVMQLKFLIQHKLILFKDVAPKICSFSKAI